MSEPRYGQVMCCGQVPKIGYHNLHEYRGQKGMRAFGCYCSKCGKHSSIIGEEPDFAISHFNRIAQRQPSGKGGRSIAEPTLNAPTGYRWGAIRIESTFMGGKESREHWFMLFHTVHEDLIGQKRNREYIIDEDRVLTNLTLMNSLGVHENLDWFTKARKCYVYVCASWSTDGTAWYNLNLNLYGAARKHILRLNEQLDNLGIEPLT